MRAFAAERFAIEMTFSLTSATRGAASRKFLEDMTLQSSMERLHASAQLDALRWEQHARLRRLTILKFRLLALNHYE